MSDRFVDKWKEEVPEKWIGQCGEWHFVGVENTAYLGNKYKYILSGTDSYTLIWSRYKFYIDLDGEIFYKSGAINIHLRSFNGEWVPQEDSYRPKSRISPISWSSIQDALTALDKKYKSIQELIKPLTENLETDNDWESVN